MVNIFKRWPLLLLLALSGCTGLKSFLEAWGGTPRLVPDRVSGGYIVTGGDAQLKQGSRLVPDGQGGYRILEP